MAFVTILITEYTNLERRAMRIACKPITNFATINSFQLGNQWQVRANEPNALYFQLVDLDQAGLRYLVGIGTSNQPDGVTVTFPSINDTLVINATATQVDPNDSSIWKVLLSSVQTPGSGNVQFAVTEGNTTRRFSVLNMMSVEYPQNDGSC